MPDYIARSGATLGSLVNARGLRLTTYKWGVAGAAGAKGVVLVVHGISSHICFDWLRKTTYRDGAEGYDGASFHEPQYSGSWVERLNAEGYVVAGMDLQSYGLSEGAGGHRGYFTAFDDLVADMVQFRREVTRAHPGLPVCLLGGSMGGCVATRVLQEDSEFTYAAAVLIAPMLSVERLKQKPVNKVLLPFVACLASCLPRLRLGQKESHVNKDQADAFQNDPLTESGSGTRALVAQQCLLAVDDARRRFDAVTAPILTVHSENDTMTDPDGSRLLVAGVASKDATLHQPEEPHFWHCYVAEPGGDRLLEHVVAWLRGRMHREGDSTEA
eukprot:TRINITY_DN25577_c0_g1_i1.p1 TRINITY_DN25577_c0_g1~~TRINITY_DN25577_c0_g1_i1.p1  ORF type:complete len:361 (+),score=126.15 TRINITY_DN25577_c0_g1_i1:97-1083(+)